MLSNLKLTEKQTGFKWNNESFQIISQISEEYLYLASKETIFQNGKLLFSRGGFRSKRSIEFNFNDQSGDIHKFEMRCFPIKSNWLNFTILIDDIVVYKGSTPIKGIFTTVAVYLPVFFLVLLTLGRLLGFFLIYFNW
jgi:hypothetical protein